MELKEIASVSGKGGLFKVIKPTRTGVILEALDEKKTKLLAGASQQVSLLKEISIYTTSKEGSYPLEEILIKINQEFGDELPVNSKSDTRDLYAFIMKVVPDYDQEKVYPSDIKKLVSWYATLSKFAPEILKKQEAEAPEKVVKSEKAPKSAEKEVTSEQPKATKKASAKKTTKE
jgi:hypothetical protein